MSTANTTASTMRCPSLKELPLPPPDKRGWPWTEESPQLPDKMPDGASWPKISIITPSFNQGKFIEETIRSILLQGYPNLEYIIVDGGSTDASVEIIKKYEKWLSFWVSEPDKGQSHAINKGFSHASGDIMNWVNSDDFLENGGIQTIGTISTEYSNHLIVGAGQDCNEQFGSQIKLLPKKISINEIIRFWQGWYNWIQPSIFFPRTALVEAGYLDETLHYVMDLDLYCRLLKICSIHYVDEPISNFRRHELAKTTDKYNDMILELSKISLRYMHLCQEGDAGEHVEQVIVFLIRRSKRLIIDKRFNYARRYLVYSFRIDFFRTINIIAKIFLKKVHEK